MRVISIMVKSMVKENISLEMEISMRGNMLMTRGRIKIVKFN